MRAARRQWWALVVRAMRRWVHRMGCGSCHKCRELAGSDAPRYVLNETNKV